MYITLNACSAKFKMTSTWQFRLSDGSQNAKMAVHLWDNLFIADTEEPEVPSNFHIFHFSVALREQP
jgi:hypothetical protein